MVDINTEHALSACFKAVADETRRTLLRQICQQGPIRVTDLADMHEMSLNGISKHLKVIEKAGLIQRTTIGREHWLQADLSKTAALEHWFMQLKSIWSIRLEQLNDTIGEVK